MQPLERSLQNICLTDKLTMAPSAKSYLTDWLALHGFDRSSCVKILEFWKAHVETQSQSFVPTSQHLELLPETIWQHASRATEQALPSLRELSRRTEQESIVEFSPDPAKFPRAFTIQEPKSKKVIVSIPFNGQPNDPLTIAHEFGHAMQVTAKPETLLPPVAREMAAFMSELFFLRFAQLELRQHSAALIQTYEKQNQRYLSRVTDILLTALSAPNPPYDYDWNYPLARIAALYVVSELDEDEIVSAITGVMPIDRIVNRLEDWQPTSGSIPLV